jgi:hypothetical protein
MRIGFDLGIVGGVVDEDVDAAELREDGVARFEQRGLAGDVGGQAEALRAVSCLELFGAEAGIGRGKVEQDDVGSSIGENRAVMIAEESGAAGDDGDAAGEVEELADAAVGGVAKVYRLRVWPPSIT